MKLSNTLIIAITVMVIVFVALVGILAATDHMEDVSAIVLSVGSFAAVLVNIFISLASREHVKAIPEQTVQKVNGHFEAAVEAAVNKCLGLAADGSPVVAETETETETETTITETANPLISGR